VVDHEACSVTIDFLNPSGHKPGTSRATLAADLFARSMEDAVVSKSTRQLFVSIH
jgi:hypothetical protein